MPRCLAEIDRRVAQLGLSARRSDSAERLGGPAERARRPPLGNWRYGAHLRYESAGRKGLKRKFRYKAVTVNTE